MADRYTPLDDLGPGSRAAGRDEKRGPVVWFLPWACLRCHRYGRIPVVTEGISTGGPQASTREYVERTIWFDHRRKSELCTARVDRMPLGRLFRFDDTGKKIIMIKIGEDADQVTRTPEPWPPWES